MIKQLEGGCQKKAYKCLASEEYYTIGYGHYGISDPDLTISESEAIELLKEDLETIYTALEPYDNYYVFTGYEYDALVSFCFNLGAGVMSQLTKKYTRSKGQIADAIPYYNHSGARVIEGLTIRREKEYNLFVNGIYPDGSSYDGTVVTVESINEDTTIGEIVDLILEDKFGKHDERKEALFELIQKFVNKRYGIE